MAKIFISYRRADSRAMTDNIHNYLAGVLGRDNVFQDVEDIPLGVNFVTYLEETIGSMDVLLVVIGQKWLSITGEDGQRRLDAPDDPVRLEIGSALRNNKLLVIPVLVDDAPMPRGEELPEELRELHFRNAARVRYNPDFERDMRDLLAKIDQQVKVKPVSRVSWVMVLPILLVLLIGGFIVATSGQFSASTTPTATVYVPTLDPLPAGEYRVLVGQIMPVSADTPSRPVTRTVVNDLRQRLEQDIPFSTLRVHEYNARITSNEEAQAAAQETGASVVVWGDYSAEEVNLQIQIGSTAAFPTIADAGLAIATLERGANVRVRLTDEREQSVAPQVVGVMTVLYMADSNGYSVLTNLATLNLLKDVSIGEITSGGVGAHVHRGLTAYMGDTQQAINEINAALDLETNALLYTIRGYAEQRLGEYENGLMDARTALSLAPDWGMPIYILGNDGNLFSNSPEEAIQHFTRLSESRPSDWFPLFNRAYGYYLVMDYDSATADVYRVINEFSPKASLPYGLAIALDLRAGRLDNITRIKETVVREFPNPTLFNRTLEALYGENASMAVGQALTSITYLGLGQFRNAIEAADAATAIDETWADLYGLKGVAYCNLDNREAAEAAYTSAIELDPEYYIVYLLRSQIRLAQGNLLGSTQDLTTVQGTEWGQRPEIQSLIEAGLKQEVTCKTFFE